MPCDEYKSAESKSKSARDQWAPVVGQFGFPTGSEFGVDLRMKKKPELLVGYGANSNPVSAKCSMCGVQMLHMESKRASSANSTKWFAIQFDLHVRTKHTKD
jgi:hypothetical protein